MYTYIVCIAACARLGSWLPSLFLFLTFFFPQRHSILFPPSLISLVVSGSMWTHVKTHKFDPSQPADVPFLRAVHRCGVLCGVLCELIKLKIPAVNKEKKKTNVYADFYVRDVGAPVTQTNRAKCVRKPSVGFWLILGERNSDTFPRKRSVRAVFRERVFGTRKPNTYETSLWNGRLSDVGFGDRATGTMRTSRFRIATDGRSCVSGARRSGKRRRCE